jgi:hypothetical protein
VKTLLATLALALLAATASADTLWTYQGNSVGEQGPLFAPPNPCACALSGSLTLDASGQPIAWNFTDGTTTLNQTDSAISFTANYTPTLFGEWFMSLTGADGIFLLTEYYGSQYEATDGGSGSLYVQGNHGTWSDPVSTPEPGTFALVGFGLLALVSRGRKRNKVSSVWEPLA